MFGGNTRALELLTASPSGAFNNLSERPYRLVNACKERASVQPPVLR